MDIIEIDGNSFCIKAFSAALPSGERGLRSFVEKTLAEQGFFLRKNSEITVFSNSVFTLLFVCAEKVSERAFERLFFS